MIRAVIVAEAWGRNEAKFQHALVGASGRELSLQLGHAKMAPFLRLQCRKCFKDSRFITPHCEFCGEFLWPNEFDMIAHWKRLREESGIAITNVFNEQPPDVCGDCRSLNVSVVGSSRKCLDCRSRHIRSNDLGFFFGPERQTEMKSWKASQYSLGTHLKSEHFHHVLRFWQEIKTLQPNLIIALGNAACWATLDQTGITKIRGTVAWSERLSCKVIPTFHPANVLRPTGRAQRPICIADFGKANRESAFSELRRPERWLTIVDPTSEAIKDAYEWFDRPALAYANDIETYKGQISIIGFARSRDDALVIVFRNTDEERPTSIGHNYFGSAEAEFAAWKLAIYGLRTPQPKIFQNGLYDISYYARMGIFPRNALHDTMLWHHSLYPELPKSLGFLGSIYSNEISWKMMARRESFKRDE